MELTPEHRERLIHALRTATENREVQRSMLARKQHDPAITPLIEITDFLASKQISEIEQALINNNIDY